MKKKCNYLLITLLIYSTSAFATLEKRMVNVAVADIRKIPEAIPKSKKLPLLSKDLPYQWTQALFGECLLVEESEGEVYKKEGVHGWLKVRVLEQEKQPQDIRDDLHGTNFEPILGYIREDQTKHVDKFPIFNMIIKKQWAYIIPLSGPKIENLKVSIGTKLSGKKSNPHYYHVNLPDGRKGAIRAKDVNVFTPKVTRSPQELRKMFLEAAMTFVQPKDKYVSKNIDHNIWKDADPDKYKGIDPYSWQGRSAFDPSDPLGREQKTSTDCSGLTHLLLPGIGRDCCDQCPFGKTIQNGSDVKAGDIIFTAKKTNPTRLTHVMIYLGKNDILEMTGAVFGSRSVSSKEKLGRDIEDIKNGQGEHEEDMTCVVYFRDFFASKKQIQDRRNRWILKE